MDFPNLIFRIKKSPKNFGKNDPWYKTIPMTSELENSDAECKIEYVLKTNFASVRPNERFYNVTFQNQVYERICKKHPKGDCVSCATFNVSRPFSVDCKLDVSTFLPATAFPTYPILNYCSDQMFFLTCSLHKEGCFARENFIDHVHKCMPELECKAKPSKVKKFTYHPEISVVEQFLHNMECNEKKEYAIEIANALKPHIFMLEHLKTATYPMNPMVSGYLEVLNPGGLTVKDFTINFLPWYLGSRMEEYSLMSLEHLEVSIPLFHLIFDAMQHPSCTVIDCLCKPS